MEEAGAHLSNSWDLEVWAAGTLQMHLSLDSSSADQPPTSLDQLSASLELVPVTKLCHTDCQLTNSLQSDYSSWEAGEQDCTAVWMLVASLYSTSLFPTLPSVSTLQPA